MNLKQFLFLVAFTFFLSGCSLVSQNQNQITVSPPAEGKKSALSLKEILNLGQSAKCTYLSDYGEITSWIKGKKIRAEGDVFADSKENQGNGGMINDGEWLYLWNNQTQEGMKYKLTALNKQPGPSVTPGEKWQDPQVWADEIEQKYQVKCEETIIDDEQFKPPSEVNFQDLTSVFENLPSVPNLPSEGAVSE